MSHNYPKVMGRLSTFFGFIGVVQVLIAVTVLVSLMTAREIASVPNVMGTLLTGVGCYAFHIILDYLVDLHDRMERMEKIHEQEYKIVVDLYRHQQSKQQASAVNRRDL